MDSSVLKFKVVGFIPSPEFQKVRFYVEHLNKFFPDKVARPEIRGMLNVAWEEYLTRLRRLKSGKSWQIKTVAIIFNGDLLGDDEDFFKYLTKCVNIKFKGVSFQELGCEQLVKHLNNLITKYQRDLVYFIVTMNCKFIGTLLFMLYSDLVPETCANFLNVTRSGAIIHRIVTNGWMQFESPDFKPPRCHTENYVVPHDRRGVLSMCLSKTGKKTDFFVTFQRSEWMDRKFIAFGQLIQGAEILNKIEAQATRIQVPTNSIKIEQIGEYSLEFYKTEEVEIKASYSDFNGKVRDDESLTEIKFRKGFYCLSSDVLGLLNGVKYEIQGE